MSKIFETHTKLPPVNQCVKFSFKLLKVSINKEVKHDFTRICKTPKFSLQKSKNCRGQKTGDLMTLWYALFVPVVQKTGYYLKLDLLNSGFSVPDSFWLYYFSIECDYVKAALESE